MSDRLTRLGLHFDELNKLSIVDTEVTSKSLELKDECTEFLENTTRFQEVVDSFISVVDSLGQEVEKEKMRAVGTRNLIKSMAKQREAKEQQYHALIIEKSTELERLRIQHQALLRTEAEQQEVIDQMVLPWFYLWLVVEVVKSEDKVATTLEPRWLRDILRDTDLSLSSILSQPVDREKVDYALQFLLGYKGLLERLIDAARTRDPRTIEVLRDLEQSGGRPVFTQLLPDLSVRQDYFKWSDENMDILRTQILEINRLIEEFKQVVIDFAHN